MNTQTKWLIGLVAALVIINLGLVAFLWLKKDEKPLPPQGKDARNFLVRELSMNEQQVKLFDSSRRQHFEKMRQYNEEMRLLKDRLFGLLKEEDSAKKNEMVSFLKDRISKIQAAIDLETFDHFSRLRSILNDDQKKQFDVIIQDVLHTMAPRGGPPSNDHDRQGPPRPDGPPQ